MGTKFEEIFRSGKDAKQVFSKEGFEPDVRNCDWLVGFGPGMLLSFWAVHCLDDVLPLRVPRVTLWKKYELQNHDVAFGRPWSGFEKSPWSTLKRCRFACFCFKKIYIPTCIK